MPYSNEQNLDKEKRKFRHRPCKKFVCCGSGIKDEVHSLLFPYICYNNMSVSFKMKERMLSGKIVSFIFFHRLKNAEILIYVMEK